MEYLVFRHIDTLRVATIPADWSMKDYEDIINQLIHAHSRGGEFEILGYIDASEDGWSNYPEGWENVGSPDELPNWTYIEYLPARDELFLLPPNLIPLSEVEKYKIKNYRR